MTDWNSCIRSRCLDLASCLHRLFVFIHSALTSLWQLMSVLYLARRNYLSLYICVQHCALCDVASWQCDYESNVSLDAFKGHLALIGRNRSSTHSSVSSCWFFSSPLNLCNSAPLASSVERTEGGISLEVKQSKWILFTPLRSRTSGIWLRMWPTQH